MASGTQNLSLAACNKTQNKKDNWKWGGWRGMILLVTYYTV